MKKRKNAKTMNVFGVGPKLVFYTILYTLLVVGISVKSPGVFQMSFLPHTVRVTLGVLLVVVGLVWYVLSAKTILKGFPAGKLCTTGVYALCRHPLYASWGVSIIPGIVLLADNWLAFTIPIFMCAVMKFLVVEEERWLEKKFGKKYQAYQKRVPGLLPLGFVK
jgi:protein-S-isoprenylcysteine O-methyltransferase Ste14